MMQFFDEFPEKKIVSTQLSWSHIIELLPLQSIESKLFYANETIGQSLGIRDLRKIIASKTFERTQIANTQISKKSKIPMNTFKDPYVLDFFELKNTYLEKDVENAILRDLENFILELGKGFTFVERQKRMIIDTVLWSPNTGLNYRLKKNWKKKYGNCFGKRGNGLRPGSCWKGSKRPSLFCSSLFLLININLIN
jgi:predicted nuclease of restriction endonuclease-like (RecB) superfamily